jgi:hypothetical protein
MTRKELEQKQYNFTFTKNEWKVTSPKGLIGSGAIKKNTYARRRKAECEAIEAATVHWMAYRMSSDFNEKPTINVSKIMGFKATSHKNLSAWFGNVIDEITFKALK